MPARPSEYLGWVPDSDPQKMSPPPASQRAAGVVPNEPLTAQHYNYCLNNLDQWVQYLDQNATTGMSSAAVLSGARLIDSSTWSFSATSGVLSWSAPFAIGFAGMPDSVNQVAAGSVTLADGDVAYVQANLPLFVSGTVTSGSNQLQNIATTQGISVGQGVSGPGLPSGTTVSSIGANVLTLSKNATSSQAVKLFAFYSTSTLSPAVSASASLAVSRNTIVLARRVGPGVLVGLGSTEATVRDGESKQIRNGGFNLLTSGVAGVAIADRKAVHIGTGSGGQTAGSFYLCDASVANGADRSTFAGFSLGAASAGGTIKVVAGGQLGGFSGLVPGAQYFVDTAAPGSITASRSSATGSYVVPVGMAISPTMLSVTNPGVAALARPTDLELSGALTAASIGAYAGTTSNTTLVLATGTNLLPSVTDAQSLGTSSRRYVQVFAKTGTFDAVECPTFKSAAAGHTFDGDILPAADTSKVLGSPSARWKESNAELGRFNRVSVGNVISNLLPTGDLNVGAVDNMFKFGGFKNLANLTGNAITLNGLTAYAATTSGSNLIPANNQTLVCQTVLFDVNGNRGNIPAVYMCPNDGFLRSFSAQVMHSNTNGAANTIQLFYTVTPTGQSTPSRQVSFATQSIGSTTTPTIFANDFSSSSYPNSNYKVALGDRLGFFVQFSSTRGQAAYLDLTVTFTI